MTRPVLEAMWPYMSHEFGNASSRHDLGTVAHNALEASRESVAEALGAQPDEIIFTSGATESNNYALKGIALAAPRDRVIVTTPIEHEAILEPLEFLKRFHDFRIKFVEVDRTGLVDLDHLDSLLDDGVTVCSIQYANSEVGTIQDLDAIAKTCHDAKVCLHTDAVQAAGVLDLKTNADLLSLSAHKFGGPKGMGVLLKKRSAVLEPLMHGGGQEGGARSGTANVAGAVGLATALTFAEADRDIFIAHTKPLRDQLIEGVLKAFPHATLTGHPTQRLAHHASFSLGDVSGESIVVELAVRGVACSSGSACAEGQDGPSYVLTALRIDDAVAQTAVRFTLGSETTREDIEYVLKALPPTSGL